MPIFASFSKRAQLAIKLARDAAAAAKQPFVGTMHLLLGLLQAGGNYPACLTDRVTTGHVQQQLDNMPHEVENVPNNPGKIALTPHVRQVFQRAAQLTPIAGAFVTAEMLMLTLIGEHPYGATELMRQLEVPFDQAQKELMAIIRAARGTNMPAVNVEKPEQPDEQPSEAPKKPPMPPLFPFMQRPQQPNQPPQQPGQQQNIQ